MVITRDQMNSRQHRTIATQPRTPGVHVQAVNQQLGVAAGKLSNSDDSDFPFEKLTDTTYPLMMALGVCWEEFRASLFPEDQLIWQPGELERDGILGTPDGLLLYETPAYWECKRTTKKVAPITDMWMYLRQGMSYCAMSHCAVTRVQYDLLFVCGDYQRPYQPMGTSTIVEFTTAECEAWWSNVLKASKNVKPEGNIHTNGL